MGGLPLEYRVVAQGVLMLGVRRVAGLVCLSTLLPWGSVILHVLSMDPKV